MRIIEGTYRKDTDERDVKLYVMDEKENSFAGIDLTKLNEEDQKVVKEAVDEFYTKLSPYVKTAYRIFTKTKFTYLEHKEI